MYNSSTDRDSRGNGNRSGKKAFIVAGVIYGISLYFIRESDKLQIVSYKWFVRVY